MGVSPHRAFHITGTEVSLYKKWFLTGTVLSHDQSSYYHCSILSLQLIPSKYTYVASKVS